MKDVCSVEDLSPRSRWRCIVSGDVQQQVMEPCSDSVSKLCLERGAHRWYCVPPITGLSYLLVVKGATSRLE